MPLYIHQRGAFKDFVDLMDKYRNHLEGIPVLVHCFTGSKDELEWILERPNFHKCKRFYLQTKAWKRTAKVAFKPALSARLRPFESHYD